MTNTTIETVKLALEDALNRTYATARAMPGVFYTDSCWTEVETRELFAKEWVCVGRVDEVAAPGDYLALDLAGEPIVVVHGLDGELRALSNVCRHRGMLLVEGKGNTRQFLCPYHNWTYDTAGALLRAPLVEPRDDFDRAACKLPAVALEVWLGFIFVSLHPNPVPLAPKLESAASLAHNYHFESMALRHVHEEVWSTNWKCLVENFMEGYHLSPLHRDTLHAINPTRLCTHFAPGEHYFGCLSGFAQRIDGGAHGHPDLTEEEANTSLMLAVPPGLMIGGGGDYSSFICVQPETAGRVRLKYGLMFFADEWPQAAVDEAVTLGLETIAEDQRALESVQRGLSSRFFEPGPLAAAEYEGTELDFFHYLARRLLPTLSAEPATQRRKRK